MCTFVQKPTPSDSWGGRMSLCKSHHKLHGLMWTSFSAPPSPSAGGWPWGMLPLQEVSAGRSFPCGPVPIQRQGGRGWCATGLLTGGLRGAPEPPGNGINTPTCMREFAPVEAHGFYRFLRECLSCLYL